MIQTSWRCALLAVFVLLISSYSTSVTAQTEDSVSQSAPVGPMFEVETRHRMFPGFRQVDTVGIDQVFLVGEEELEARIVLFNPHLGITTDGQRLQMSDTLYNPAVQVEVKTDGEVTQTSWGFYYTEAPHFYRDQMLGFRIISFDVGEEYIPKPKEK